ncbi:MAG: DUF1858 domain-containing protein [Candidatus Diapherotrites archaeon]|uniref:DUF1858 domain-containing protein n=1 Tax=Candidatus Iainarchaeum sp. TaxID=3101447 RepID=A0A8T4KWB6_9ARCH|nr:DUF1858 domain-containing protein [Candidatus Diapherotrites archaeon]
MPLKKKKASLKKPKISKTIMLGELIQKFPKSAPFLAEAGLHCIGCHISAYETLEQGCKAHGMADKEIDLLLKRMNASV